MANKNSETQENPTQLERQLNRIRYTKALGRLVGVDLREEEGRIRKNFGNLQIETSPGVMDQVDGSQQAKAQGARDQRDYSPEAIYLDSGPQYLNCDSTRLVQQIDGPNETKEQDQRVHEK